jgi:hypothetical protein
MIGVSANPRAPARRPGPDVLPDAGFMPWSRAMGVAACRVACRYLIDETTTRTVVDPFCGRGTVLAVANAMGLDAIGVDLSAKRVRAARAFVIGAEEQRVAGTAREALDAGARAFDAGAYWEAHEIWETRWREERDESERRLLQGLIQIAAAFHHLVVRGDGEAATRLFAKGLAKLEAVPPDVDLAAFRAGVEACRSAAAAGVIAGAPSTPRLSR